MRKTLQLLVAVAALSGLVVSAAANTRIRSHRARLVASAARS